MRPRDSTKSSQISLAVRLEVHPGISIKERRNTDEVMIKMKFLTAFFINLIIRSKGWFEKKAVPEFIQNTIFKRIFIF